MTDFPPPLPHLRAVPPDPRKDGAGPAFWFVAGAATMFAALVMMGVLG